MKKIIGCMVLLAILMSATTAFAATDNAVPNLVGSWVGKVSGHMEKEGFYKGEAPVKFIIEKQDGRVFTGRKIWISNKKEMTEGFSGVVAIDNKRIFATEHEDGLINGDIISKNKMYVYYVEDGENAKVLMYELNRGK